jgi:membrane fusion protein
MDLSKNSQIAVAKKTNLFRQQAIDNIAGKSDGTILLSSSRTSTISVASICLLIVSIILFFFLFSITRKAECQGVLVPSAGTARIVSAQPGTVTIVSVEEGQIVKEGDTLFVVSGERSSSFTNNTQKSVSNLLGSRSSSLDTEVLQSGLQSKQKEASLKARILNIRDEILTIDEQIEIQSSRSALTAKTFERFKDLSKNSFISSAQLQDKQAEVLDQQQRLVELQRTKSATRRELLSMSAELVNVAAQSARELAGLKRLQSSIQQELAENEARRETRVLASKPGVVTAINIEVGQSITSNTLLASIISPADVLDAEIFAPSKSIGFVRPGMRVLLRYQSFPYQKFGQHEATVTSISLTSLKPEDFISMKLGTQPGTSFEPLYRIRLKLDKQDMIAYGKNIPLRAGMLMDASILLDSRKIYEWILEPLYTISGY